MVLKRYLQFNEQNMQKKWYMYIYMYCSSPSESETIKGFLLTLTVFDSHVRPLSCAVTQSCSDWAAHTDRNQLTGILLAGVHSLQRWSALTWFTITCCKRLQSQILHLSAAKPREAFGRESRFQFKLGNWHLLFTCFITAVFIEGGCWR